MDFSVIQREIAELKFFISELAPGVTLGAEKGKKYIQMSAFTARLQQLFVETEKGINILMGVFAKHGTSDYKKAIEMFSGMKDKPLEEMEEATREKIKDLINFQIEEMSIAISKGPEKYQAPYALEQATLQLNKLLTGAEPLTTASKWAKLLIDEYRNITEAMIEEFKKVGLGGIVAKTPPLKEARDLTAEMLEKEEIKFTPGKIIETEEIANKFWNYLEEKGKIPKIMDILGIKGEEGTEKGKAEAEALFFGQQKDIKKKLPQLAKLLKSDVQEFWTELLEEGLSEATRVPAMFFWAMGATARKTFYDDFLLVFSEEIDPELLEKALKESGFRDTVYEKIKEVGEEGTRAFFSEQKIFAKDIPKGRKSILDIAALGERALIKLPGEREISNIIDLDKNTRQLIVHLIKLESAITEQLKSLGIKSDENKENIIKEVEDLDLSGSDRVYGE